MKELDIAYPLTNTTPVNKDKKGKVIDITDMFAFDIELFSADKKTLLCQEEKWKLKWESGMLRWRKTEKWHDKKLGIAEVKRGETKTMKAKILAPDFAKKGKYFARVLMVYVSPKYKIHWDEAKIEWHEFKLK
jgi:hypothetical protein